MQQKQRKDISVLIKIEVKIFYYRRNFMHVRLPSTRTENIYMEKPQHLSNGDHRATK